MEAEVAAADLTLIKDEEILKRMWAETEDYGRKKDIRARMYKLREQRLKDFYTSGEVENEITGRKHTTTRHTESIGDQGFLTMKTKEIRDSESPTRDFSRRGNNGYWTSVEERGYTTGNQEGMNLERSEESRKGEGLVIEGNTETRMALTAQNLHEKTSKSDDNMSMKSETSKQSQAFASSSVTDTGDKISQMETSESENLQSSRKEQKSETSSSSTTKVSSSTSSSKKVVSSSVTSSSYQVTGDETRRLRDNEIKPIKSYDDTSKFTSNLRSNEQKNIHQSNLQQTVSHYDDSNNLLLQQPIDRQLGQIQDFNVIKSSTQQTSHDSSQYQNEHSTQSYKTIQSHKTTSETDKHDSHVTDTENQKRTMINSRSNIDDHVTKESTVRNDKNVHDTKNIHYDEEILRMQNQINRENLDVNEFITNEKIDSSTLKKITPRPTSGANTPSAQHTVERYTTVREVSNDLRDSTTTQSQTKTNTDQKILNEINKLDTYLANQNTPAPSEPATPKSVTDGAQWTIVSDRDGEFIYQNDKSPRDNSSHAPVQSREPIVKHPSSLDLPKDATDGQYVTTYQQSYNRISVDNSPSHEFFAKTLRASPDRLTPSPTKSSRGSLDRNSPDRRLRAPSKGSLDRSSPETSKKRSYSKGSLDRNTPERSYRTSPSKTPDRERRGSSESYTIERKIDSNTIEKKKDTNIIERKKETNTIERKKDTNTIERKKDTNTIERKKDTNSIDRKKGSNTIENKIDTNTFDRKKDSRRKTTEITQQMVKDTTNKTKRKFSSTQQKAANKTRISTPGVSPSTSPTRTVSKKEVTSGSESDTSQATYNKMTPVKSIHDDSVITSKTDKRENIIESTVVTNEDITPNRSKPRDKSPEYSSEGSVSREINKSLKTRSDIKTTNNSFKPISQTTTDHFILEEQKNSVREITEELSDYSDTQKIVNQDKVIHTTDQHSDTDEVLETDSIDGDCRIVKNKTTTEKISDHITKEMLPSSSPERSPEEIQRPNEEMMNPKSSPEKKVSSTPKTISPERKPKDSSDRQPLKQLNQKRSVDSPSSTLERKPKVSSPTTPNLNQRPEHSPSPSPERHHQPASKSPESKTERRTLDENRRSVSSSPERRYPQGTKETNSEKYKKTSNQFISEEMRSENRERSISSSPERKPSKPAQKTSSKTTDKFVEKSPLSRQQRPSSPYSSPERNNTSPERRPTKQSQKTSPRAPGKNLSQKSLPTSHQQRPSPSTSPERYSSPERRPTKLNQKTSPQTPEKKPGEKLPSPHQQRPSPSTSPERNISPARISKPTQKTSLRTSEKKISDKSPASRQQRPISPYSSPERYSSPDRKIKVTQQKKNTRPTTTKQTPKTGIPTTQQTTQKIIKETVRVTKHSSIPRANKLSPRNSKDKIEPINNRNSTQVIRKSTPIPKAQQIVKVTSVTRTTSKINEHRQEISKPSQMKSPYVPRTPVETNPKRTPSKIATPKYIPNKPKTPDSFTSKATIQKMSKTSSPKTPVNTKRSPHTPSKKTTNIIEDIEITENTAVNQRTTENTEFLNSERSNLELEDENPPEEFFDEYDDKTDDTSPDRQPKSHRTTDDVIVNVTTVKTTVRKTKTSDSNINNTLKTAPKITKPKQDKPSEKKLSDKKTQEIRETISERKTSRKLKKEQKVPRDMGSSSSSSSSEDEEIEQSELEELQSCELKNSNLVTHASNQDLLTVVVQHPKSSRESSPGYPCAGQPFCTTSEDGESNPRYADYIVEPDDVEVFDKNRGPVTPIRLTEDESVDVKSVADRVNVFLEATRVTNETVTQPEVAPVSSPKSVLKAKTMFENIAKNQTTSSSKKPTNKQPKSPVEDHTPKYSPSKVNDKDKERTSKAHNYDDIVINEEINIQHNASKSFIEDEITAQLLSDKTIISKESPQTLKQTKPNKEEPYTKKTPEKKPVESTVDILSKKDYLEETSHEEVNIIEEIKNDINEQISRNLLEEETEEVYNITEETTPKRNVNKQKSPSPQRQLPKSGPKDTPDTRKPTERRPSGTVGTKKELFENKTDQIEINQQQTIKRTIEDSTVRRHSSKGDITTRRPSLKEKSPSPQRSPSKPKEHTDSKKPFERKPSVHVDVSSKKDFFERKVKDISVSASKSTPKKKEQSHPKSKPVSQPSSNVQTPEKHQETRQQTVLKSTVNTSIEFGEPEKHIIDTQTDDEQEISETIRKTSHHQETEQNLSKTEYVIISSETDQLNEVDKFEPNYQRPLETENPKRKTSKPEEIVRKPSKPQEIIRTPKTEDSKSRPVDENRAHIRTESYMRSTTSSTKRDHTPEKHPEEIIRKTPKPDDIVRKPTKPQEIIRTTKTEDIKTRPVDENRSHIRTESYMRSTTSSTKRDHTPEKHPEEIIRKTPKPDDIVRKPTKPQEIIRTTKTEDLKSRPVDENRAHIRTESYMRSTTSSTKRDHTPEKHPEEIIRKTPKPDDIVRKPTKPQEIIRTTKTEDLKTRPVDENRSHTRTESYMRSTTSSSKRDHTPEKQPEEIGRKTPKPEDILRKPSKPQEIIRTPKTEDIKSRSVDENRSHTRNDSYMRSTTSSSKRDHTPEKQPEEIIRKTSKPEEIIRRPSSRTDSYMKSTITSSVRSQTPEYQTIEPIRKQSECDHPDSRTTRTSESSRVQYHYEDSDNTYQTRETDVTDDTENISSRRESYMRSTVSSRGHTPEKHSRGSTPEGTRKTRPQSPIKPNEIRRRSGAGEVLEDMAMRRTSIRTETKQEVEGKFGVTLRKTPSTTKMTTKPAIQRQNSKPSDIVDIESIFDLELLEEMLLKAVGYDDRRRIRAQIRVVKKYVEEEKNATVITKVTKTSSIQSTLPSVRDIKRQASPSKSPDMREPVYSTPKSSLEKRVPAHSPTRSSPERRAPTQPQRSSPERRAPMQSQRSSPERRAPTHSPRSSPERRAPMQSQRSSPERRVPTHSPTRSPEKRVPTHSPTRSPEKRVPTHSPTRSPERRVPTHSPRVSPERRVKAGSPEKHYPERSPTMRVSSERPLTNGYKDSRTITETTTVRTQSVRKSTTSDTRETCPTDLITSSYGVGPTDENGRPLFGLRALRRTSTNKALTGETVEQETVTEVGEESSLFGLRALQQTSTDNMPAESSQLRELVERHQQYVRESSSKDLQPVQKPKAKLRDSFILTQEDDVTSVLQSEPDDNAKSLSLKSIIQKHESNTGSNVQRTMESKSTVVKSRSTVSSDGKVSLHRDVIHGEVSSKNNEEPHGKVTRSSYSYQSPKDKDSQASITSSTTTSQIGSRKNSGPRIEEITDGSMSEMSRRYSKEYTVEEEEVVSDRRRSSGVSVEENVKTYTSILKNSNAPGRRSSGPRITDVSDVSSEQEERRSSITKTSVSSRVGSDTSDSKTPFSSRQQTESKTDTPKKVITRGDSVKALQHKFQQATEAANQPATRPYPRAGLILRSNTLQHIDDQTLMSSSTKQSSSVERTTSKSKQQIKETKSHDVPSSPVLKTQVVTQDDSEVVQTTQVSRPEEATSFLDNKTKVTGVQDILTRMRNADLVTEKSDTTEDAEARALLNKFLGASVILQGMEQGMRASQKHTEAEGPTSPTSAALVIQAEKQRVKATSVPTVEDDIDDINDEKQLRILLEACSDYDSRRKLRARLRTIMADHKGGPEDVEESHDVSESSSEVVKQGDTIVKTEVHSRTTSSSAKLTKANSVQSPFAKFRQLERQNSAPSAGRPPPLFKFTEPKLAQSASTIKERLLNWVQAQTRHYKNIQIENFSTSWSNGLAFCALIHHFCPTAFDYDSLTPDKRRYNFELAFRVAEEEADIFPLLDVEDMVVLRKPDWKCVFTYVQSIYRRFHDSPDALPVF